MESKIKIYQKIYTENKNTKMTEGEIIMTTKKIHTDNGNKISYLILTNNDRECKKNAQKKNAINRPPLERERERNFTIRTLIVNFTISRILNPRVQYSLPPPWTESLPPPPSTEY